MSKEMLCKRLQKCGQEHVLRWWDELSADEQDGLAAQIESLDLDFIAREKEQGSVEPSPDFLPRFEPPPAVKPSGSAQDEEAATAGEEMLAHGEVGLVLVAGGQGSRLGYDGPKGTFPIGPITGKTLFHLHAERILAAHHKYGAAIPLYIMTSDATDQATRDFFADNDYLGLGEDGVLFFTQGNMPVVDRNWKLLMNSKNSIAVSPNGHGGCIQALKDSGMIDHMREHGIRHLSYFQVDNVLVQTTDPVFLGYHGLRESEMSLKVLSKRDPEERLGVVGSVDGKLYVVEYSDLPKEKKHERNHDGQLRYRMGSIAIHAFTVDFLDRMSQLPGGMPLHRAEKDVAYIDSDGNAQHPCGEKNGIKFESFIFDVLPEAANALVFETVREADFSPVKNPEGEDSPATARQDLANMYAGWLDAAGVRLPRDAQGNVALDVEIGPLFALDAVQLQERLAGQIRIGNRTAN